ncbi:hypothetical protein EK21DRAFT_52338 [Setomelanomma holmii]|uniref:Uncharacterized protein n=1 Tax=Setomelanomma holmii TaxID=210430 RepID=A0A9P4HKW1_9PLEO|nr:hypothetical protein EK21DRAFT_52338 [Setomelanomma holmii]
MLSLEPSSSDIESHLTPLDRRLQDLEHTTRLHENWHPPAVSPKSPEYSIIDIVDLSSATKLLEDISRHTNSTTPLSPHAFLSKFKWTWDPEWKEFYTQLPNHSSYIFLSRWKYNKQRQAWEHVNISGTDSTPETAAEMLGSWEDWSWNPLWEEWYLPWSQMDDGSKCCLFTSRWELRENGEFVYTGR